MTSNYRMYPEQFRAWQSPRSDDGSLGGQLDELFRCVLDCEASWRLDDRIDRALNGRRQDRSR
jgi:hypothetical protein